MKAYRILFALLFLVFYSSFTLRDFMSPAEIIAEYNNNVAIVEDVNTAQSTINLTDFFQAYIFNQRAEVRPMNTGKMISHHCSFNRNDKIVVAYQDSYVRPDTELKRSGNKLLGSL